MVDLLAGGRAKPLWVDHHAHIAAEGGIGVGLGADSKSVSDGNDSNVDILSCLTHPL